MHDVTVKLKIAIIILNVATSGKTVLRVSRVQNESAPNSVISKTAYERRHETSPESIKPSLPVENVSLALFLWPIQAHGEFAFNENLQA